MTTPSQAMTRAELGTALEQREATTSTSPASITEMLHFAIEKNVPVETLEKLVALHERVSDRAAASEFAEALASFQMDCPPIAKTSKANIVTRGGGSYGYRYAELDTIANTVRPLLHTRGLSYSWDSSIEGKLLVCVCTLRHVNGHHATASFSCPIDSASAMSEQQKHAAALTYARRQSLIQVLGITTADPDTDGADPETITKEQAAELRESVEDLKADGPRFLQYMGVEAYEDIRASDWRKATNVLKAKREQRDREAR